jgi:hypothetical protein
LIYFTKRSPDYQVEQQKAKSALKRRQKGQRGAKKAKMGDGET